LVAPQRNLGEECVLRREQEFHAALAENFDAPAMPPLPGDHLEEALFARAGRLAGQRVLEAGCGTGDVTLQLLERGAQVTALDVSPRMIEIARERAERFIPDASVEWQVAPVEETGFSASTFDVAVGKWILHHADIPRSAAELARVLRPEGRGLFIENSALNPLLALARRHLAGRWGIPRYGTEDEHPLTREDYACFRQKFPKMQLVFPDFFFFTLLDRQIWRYRSPTVTTLTRWLDDKVFERVPPLQKYSFHVILELGR
jgi:ubiquinone/menaquinone biosynthesis C-methylase UbiE